jgi:hypothetical protein
VASRIVIVKKTAQFYQKGVVPNSTCSAGLENEPMKSVIAVIGYNRIGVDMGLGQGISKPFWQVRWAYGPNYGVFGSMWI